MKNKTFPLPLFSLLLMSIAASVANATTLPDAEQWTETASQRGVFGWGNYEGTQASITADATDKTTGNVSIKYSGIDHKTSRTLGPALTFPKGHYLDVSAIAGGKFAFDVKTSDLSGLKFMQLVLISDGVQAHQISRNLPLQEGWNHFSFPFPKMSQLNLAGWNGNSTGEFNPAEISQIRFRFIYDAPQINDPAHPRNIWFDNITFTNDKSAAQQYTVVEQKDIATDVRIVPGGNWKTQLPPLDSADARLLRITVRRDNPQMGGYGAYLHVALNGEPLDASKNRYLPRLINKPLSFFRASGQEVAWNQGDGIWLTIFSPGFDTDFKKHGPNTIEPYTYLLDVSDQVKPGQVNTLELSSYVTTATAKDIVADVEWIAAQLPREEPIATPPTIAVTPNIKVNSDGTLQISTSDKPLIVQSTFSVPGGGQNHFGEASKEAQWKPEVSQQGKDQWKIEAVGKYYQVIRKIHQIDGRIEVQDTFRNLTNEDVGIIFTNEFDLADHPGINYMRIGGLRGQGTNNINSAGNPTLFLPIKNSSLTMVAEDDFYRNQGNFYFDTDTKRSGISDSMFALAPHADYTIKWSIYTLPSNDYFDMINHVRRDWDVNSTIQGPIYFTNYDSIAKSTPEALKEMIKRNNVRYIAFWEVRTTEPSPKWDNKRVLGRGVGMLKPDLREEMELEKQAVANLHAADPNIKVAPYNHAFFIAPEIEGDPEYKDSWIVDSNGERTKSQYSDKVYYTDRTVFPTLTNSYGKAYLKLMDHLFDETKIDWLYWDESNGPGMTQPDKEAHSGRNLPSNITFNAWDGHSAVIDPETGMITQKIGILPILSGGVFEKAIQKARDHGGIVQFNGVPTTSMRQHSQTQSFVESQWDITRVYRTHLSTPMAFGLGDPDMATLRRTLDFGTIYARTMLGYHSDIVSRFYPFTPIELHEGWLKGKERIITNRSGKFGWDEPFTGTLYFYDKDAKVAKTQHFTTPTKAADIEVPDGGIAILVRDEA